MWNKSKNLRGQFFFSLETEYNGTAMCRLQLNGHTISHSLAETVCFCQSWISTQRKALLISRLRWNQRSVETREEMSDHVSLWQQMKILFFSQGSGSFLELFLPCVHFQCDSKLLLIRTQPRNYFYCEKWLPKNGLMLLLSYCFVYFFLRLLYYLKHQVDRWHGMIARATGGFVSDILPVVPACRNFKIPKLNW